MTPQATRQGLNTRIARFPAPERGLRTNEIVFRRLLVRLHDADPERWVVKGGVALLLRLDPNRTSADIDLTYIDAAGEQATMTFPTAGTYSFSLPSRRCPARLTRKPIPRIRTTP